MEDKKQEQPKKRIWKIKPRSLTHREFRAQYDRKFSYEHVVGLMDEGKTVEATEMGMARLDYFIDEIYKEPAMRDWPQHELAAFIQHTVHISIGLEEEDEEIKN
jgi:hypothetical protein